MPIIFKTGDNKAAVRICEYANEYELQDLIAENPELLMADDEPSVVLVQRELNLLNAGSLDLLLVDSEGRPTAVEVKLARNTQSRREVVGQIFDYVSDLAQMTVDELDQSLNGQLDTALKSFCGDDYDENIVEKLWRSCGANLRAGQVRIVVAIDDASEDLIRIVSFINDHSDIDVRLVSISKYVSGDNEVVLVPRLLVHGGKPSKIQRDILRDTQREMSTRFQEVISVYSTIAPNEYVLRGNV